uniref:Uncharacterized protein n=1 Tax=Arcella intermedia TaxID=1963864 RepID=A0A6B2LLH8_9EUKA
MDIAEKEEEDMGDLIKCSEGFLILYAVDWRHSLEEAHRFREEVLRIKEVNKFPMVLIGNKCDLELKRECTKEDGEALASCWAVPFFEVSALSRANVKEAFIALLREIKKWGGLKGKSHKRGGGCILL